jgi:hypothetical protein
MEAQTEIDMPQNTVLDKMKSDKRLGTDDLFALFSQQGYHAIEIYFGDGTGRRMSNESFDKFKQELAESNQEHIRLNGEGREGKANPNQNRTCY